MTNKENQKTDREFKIFIRSVNEWVVVSEEVYRAYYRDIWATRKRAQDHGCCTCPKTKNWSCDGDCYTCAFQAAGDLRSLDFTTTDEDGNEKRWGDSLQDDSLDAQSLLEERELLEVLYEKLQELDPDGRRICELLMEGKTERDIADIMGFAHQSAVNHRKSKAFNQLRVLLHDYL